MTLKKIALLAVSAMALLAFAIPAVASADQWYTGAETITEDHFTLDGELLASAPEVAGGTTLGFCPVEADVTFTNPGGSATAEVSELRIDSTPEECIAEAAGGLIKCDITAAGGLGPYPWHVDVATGEDGIEITGAGFFNIFPAGCPLGEGVTASGTATGTWSNESHCIEFNEDGDLEAPSGAKVFVTGAVCDTSETLELH